MVPARNCSFGLVAAIVCCVNIPELRPGCKPMLSPDSPRWKELRQAYGTAEAVPELLRAMEKEDAQQVAMTTSGGGSLAPLATINS